MLGWYWNTEHSAFHRKLLFPTESMMLVQNSFLLGVASVAWEQTSANLTFLAAEIRLANIANFCLLHSEPREFPRRGKHRFRVSLWLCLCDAPNPRSDSFSSPFTTSISAISRKGTAPKYHANGRHLRGEPSCNLALAKWPSSSVYFWGYKKRTREGSCYKIRHLFRPLILTIHFCSIV